MIASVVLTVSILPIVKADTWDCITPLTEPVPSNGQYFLVTEKYLYVINLAVIYYLSHIDQLADSVKIHTIFGPENSVITGYYATDDTSSYFDLGSNGGIITLGIYHDIPSLMLRGPYAGSALSQVTNYDLAYYVVIHKFDLETGNSLATRSESGFKTHVSADNEFQITNTANSGIFSGNEKFKGYGIMIDELDVDEPLILWGASQDWQEDIEYIRSNAVLCSTALNQIMFYLGSWENRWVEAESIRQDYQEFVENTLYNDFISWFNLLLGRLRVIADYDRLIRGYLVNDQAVELTTIHRDLIEVNSYLYDIEQYMKTGGVPETTTGSNWSENLSSAEAQAQQDITPEEAGSVLNLAFNSSTSSGTDEVKRWISWFENAKLVGLCIFALAMGSVILTLGKKKSE